MKSFLKAVLESVRRKGLADSFPTFQQINAWNYGPQMTEPEFHDAMIKLLDERIVGMDGFKYCWPEVAAECRAKFLRRGK